MLLSRLPLRIATALDLHVLGLPPAFALSQDQTLKLDEIFETDWSSFACAKFSRFDEVHPLINCLTSDVPLKRRPSEVSSDRSRVEFLQPELRSARTPPSTFLFLPIHLSNNVGT